MRSENFPKDGSNLTADKPKTEATEINSNRSLFKNINDVNK